MTRFVSRPGRPLPVLLAAVLMCAGVFAAPADPLQRIPMAELLIAATAGNLLGISNHDGAVVSFVAAQFKIDPKKDAAGLATKAIEAFTSRFAQGGQDRNDGLSAIGDLAVMKGSGTALTAVLTSLAQNNGVSQESYNSAVSAALYAHPVESRIVIAKLIAGGSAPTLAAYQDALLGKSGNAGRDSQAAVQITQGLVQNGGAAAAVTALYGGFETTPAGDAPAKSTDPNSVFATPGARQEFIGSLDPPVAAAVFAQAFSSPKFRASGALDVQAAYQNLGAAEQGAFAHGLAKAIVTRGIGVAGLADVLNYLSGGNTDLAKQLFQSFNKSIQGNILKSPNLTPATKAGVSLAEPVPGSENLLVTTPNVQSQVATNGAGGPHASGQSPTGAPTENHQPL